MTDLTALRERVREASGPDRGLDGRIAWAFGWRFNGFIWAEDEIGSPETAPDFDDWAEIGGHWAQPGDSFCDISEDFDSERWPNPPDFTASVDAALALVEKVLPGWGVMSRSTFAWIEDANRENYADSQGSTRALAILSALLTALIEQDKSS